MLPNVLSMKKRIILFILIVLCMDKSYAFPADFVSAPDSVFFQNLSVSDFRKMLTDTTVQLVDVRTPAEFAEGHIEGALNIEVRDTDFEKNIDMLKPDRPVAVYCRSGVRGRRAAGKLAEKGFQVYNLDQGFLSWQKEKNAGKIPALK